MIDEEINPESTLFTTIANIYATKNPKAAPIKIEYDPDGDVIITDINYPAYENLINYLCNHCSETRTSKLQLKFHNKATHPTTTSTPKPEPPDPHPHETKALKAQVSSILQTLGLTHTTTTQSKATYQPSSKNFNLPMDPISNFLLYSNVQLVVCHTTFARAY